MGRVLLVIDMLKDFVDADGALSCGEAAREIVPFVAEKVRQFDRAGDQVIFIMDAHDPDDREFTRFPRHCVRGTPGAELVAELAALEKGLTASIRVPKTRYSGFYGTDLERILQALAPSEVHVVGVCTNICVLYTVEELCNRDYFVVVYRDGVASFDVEAHAWALKQMETVLGAKVL